MKGVRKVLENPLKTQSGHKKIRSTICIVKRFFRGEPSGIRTPGTLIKSPPKEHLFVAPMACSCGFILFKCSLSQSGYTKTASAAVGRCCFCFCGFCPLGVFYYGNLQNYCAVYPPSIGSAAPVTNLPSSEARKRTPYATSSGSPKYPRGYL